MPTSRQQSRGKLRGNLKVIFSLFCFFNIFNEGESSIISDAQAAIASFEQLFQSGNLSNTVAPALIKYGNQSDIYLTAPQLIEKNGYPAEIHTVTTSDGYILEMHRIPYSPKSPAASNKPVIFLQHGLLSSSADWIILGPTKSLAYLLADAGYDVWMGNARGNTYSTRHTTLSTSSNKFWDFSWHEMGIYDLPAAIDYVLSNTSQQNLYYVGHSMGTTMFFVLTSTLPQYNAKIRQMTALAPIAFMNYVDSPFSKLFGFNPLLQAAALGLLGVKQWLPGGTLMTTVANTLCSQESIVQQMCSSLVFIICGFDPDEIESSMLPVILSHAPAGSSAKALIHYAQLLASGHFRQFDYLPIGNEIRYKHLAPPDYNLTAISAPVWMVYGDNDWYGDPEDVHKLNRTLPNSAGEYRVTLPTFNHVDFLWAKDVKPLLNDIIIEFIKKF